MIHTVIGFGIVNKAEIDVFLELSCFFDELADVGKKDFFSDQCKEIKENNKMGKTRDLFMKTRDIKGIFHAKISSIKDRNGMPLTQAEDSPAT